MSYIPETVIWQSPNGLWNLGVYQYFSAVDEDATVDETLDSFQFVSQEHPSIKAAEASWKGVKNGDDFIIEYDMSTKEEINHLEELKNDFLSSHKKQKRVLVLV